METKDPQTLINAEAESIKQGLSVRTDVLNQIDDVIDLIDLKKKRIENIEDSLCISGNDDISFTLRVSQEELVAARQVLKHLYVDVALGYISS